MDKPGAVYTTTFFLLFLTGFEFGLPIIPEPAALLKGIWESLNEIIFSFLEIDSSPEIHSDSFGMLSFIGAIGILAYFLSQIITRSESEFIKKYSSVGSTIICYYLGLMFFHYGINKIFGWQFYIPEPGILHSKLGYLEKDLLFWSTMAASKVYTVSTGIIETAIGICIIIPRTRFIGLIAGVLALVHIFLINIGFDISVKMYSFLLLGLCLSTVLYYWRAYNMKEMKLPEIFSLRINEKKGIVVSIFILICIDTLYPYHRANWVYGGPHEPLSGTYQISEGEFLHIGNLGYMVIQEGDLIFDYKINAVFENAIIIEGVGNVGIIDTILFEKDTNGLYIINSQILPDSTALLKMPNHTLPYFKDAFNLCSN